MRSSSHLVSAPNLPPASHFLEHLNEGLRVWISPQELSEDRKMRFDVAPGQQDRFLISPEYCLQLV